MTSRTKRSLFATVSTAIAVTVALLGVPSVAHAAAPGPQSISTGGLCLQTLNDGTGDGTAVVVVTCDSSAGESWALNAAGEIRNGSKCLDVTNGQASAGTTVQVYSCNSTSAQRWNVLSDGSISSDKSGRCLTTRGASAAATIENCDPNESAQRWSAPATAAPSIVAVPNQSATVNVATGVKPVANGGFGIKRWSATGLPAGMDINSTDGTLVGAPSMAGTFTTTLRATDTRGASATRQFTWTVAAPQINNTYYVDCSAPTSGNGSSSSPWNSLASVNETTFGAGAQIQLRRGTTCTGNLVPKGNATASAPNTITAYGAGELPIIQAAGRTEAAVHLIDQSYWIVQNVEARNTAADGVEARRSGIRVTVSGTTTQRSITVQNNVVTAVTGTTDRGRDKTAFYLSQAIGVHTPIDGGRIDGLTIRNNDIHDTKTSGVGIYGNQGTGDNNNAVKNRFVLVADNSIVRNANDGIVICVSESPLITGNLNQYAGTNAVNPENIAGIWAWGSSNPTFQYNEVSNIIADVYDAQAWDCDGYIDGTCTYQYNYDHSNHGGILLNCVGCGGGSTTVVDYHHNVSIGDCRVISTYGAMDSFKFNNNTVDCVNANPTWELPAATHVANNIFIGPAGAVLDERAHYSSNVYRGFTAPASDIRAVTADPVFSGSTGEKWGIEAVGSYRLASSSPAIANGIALPVRSGQDYWRNVVTPGAAHNRGAYEGLALTTPQVLDDNSSAFTYSSGWNASSGAGAVGGSDHWTNVAGASAQVTFTGTQVSLIASQATNNGLVSVSIDGAPARIVNLWAPMKRLGVNVFSSQTLSSGSHTLVITVLGKKDQRSSGTYGSVDALEVRP